MRSDPEWPRLVMFLKSRGHSGVDREERSLTYRGIRREPSSGTDHFSICTLPTSLAPCGYVKPCVPFQQIPGVITTKHAKL